MSGKKLGRVPVLEDAFEINLAKLLAVSKRSGHSLLKLTDGMVAGEVLITDAKLAVRFVGRVFSAEIVPVMCLKGRERRLLKCPRAHEGNFQSLYYWAGELACRQCHALRYRSNLAASVTARARLARQKIIKKLGGELGCAVPHRLRYKWRRRHLALAGKLADLSRVHYADVRAWLNRQRTER